jgi:putative ABC transport system permease protein
MDNDWGNYGWRIFLQIQPGVSIGDIEKKLTAINVRNQPTLKPIDVGAYVLQPLKHIHLYAPDGSSSGMQTVGIFTLIAIFILLIASINYINLSTARAILRSREVSIRKVIGAARRQLITQFVLETSLFFFIAVIVSFCCLIPMAMPLFNSLSGKDAHFSLLDPALWKVAGITVGICTLASSIYPAILLSSFRPIEALKGKLNLGGGNTRFRKGLVVCQFVFSISLIIGTLIVNHECG